ncbi:unnamed protein product, partial [Ectocarpus sp. 12 AP-2014]
WGRPWLHGPGNTFVRRGAPRREVLPRSATGAKVPSCSCRRRDHRHSCENPGVAVAAIPVAVEEAAVVAGAVILEGRGRVVLLLTAERRHGHAHLLRYTFSTMGIHDPSWACCGPG